MKPAEKARLRLYKTAEKWRLPVSSTLSSLYRGKNLPDFRIKLFELQSKNAFARMQNQVKGPGQFKQMLPHHGPHAPANTVPHHGPAQNLAHGKTYTWSAGPVAYAVKSCHVPGEMLSACFIDHLKVSMLQETRVSGEAL